MSKYATLDTSVYTLLYVGSTQGRRSSKSAIAAPSLCRCQFFALIPLQVIPICGPVISKMPVLVAGCLLANKGCGTVVGGNRFQKKFLLKESSPHRYAAVDPDLSILFSFMTFYFFQNVQVESLHQSFKPAGKKRSAP